MFDGQFFPGDPIQFEGRGSPRNPWYKRDMKEIITSLGLTTGLKLVLDAGDSSSYSGSGQSWLDLSGNGYDFFRGANNSAAADDPTFNGSAGTLSSAENWSFDGGDVFTYDSANETWMESLHKDSAVFSVAFWFQPASLTSSISLFRTRNTGVTVGIDFRLINTSGRPICTIGNGADTNVLASVSVGGTTTTGAWNFVACSIDEAGNTQTFQRNGTQASSTCAYVSPSAGAAARTLTMGHNDVIPNGSLMGEVAAWQGTALTAAQLLQLYRATRGRYGV